jgi:hypothetical protein
MVEGLRCALFFTVERVVMHVTEHELSAYDLDRQLVVNSLRLVYLISSLVCGVLSVAVATRKLSQLPKVRYFASQLFKRLAIQRAD